MSPSPPGTPSAAERTIDAAGVRALLRDQHPDLAELPIAAGPEGWDNVTYRLGSALAVRLPRRQIAAKLIEHEQAWLPQLAPRLAIPIPAPVRRGRPSAAFPWPWSVIPWFTGQTALVDPLQASEAPRLGGFLRRLHTIPRPDDPPVNPYRGGPLAPRLPQIDDRLTRADRELDGAAAAARHLTHVAAGRAINVAPCWLHGDLHSKNVLAVTGRISAVIDWGDICVGDPATDLAAVWIMFHQAAHDGFWAEYGPVSALTRQRAAAWAVAFGLMLWDSHRHADPAFAAAGLEAIRRVVNSAGLR